jgi:gliding motility-associated-like protein
MKRIYLILVVLSFLYIQKTYSQNLAPNPSFETYSSCPTTWSQLTVCTSWNDWRTTPDYYNSCNGGTVSTPANNRGNQVPSNGVAYVSITTYVPGNTNYREILGAQLTTPLVVGQQYHLEMKVSVSDNYGYASDIGMQFFNSNYSTASPAPLNNTFHLVSASPITDKTNWILISGNYIATQAYTHVGVGNFNDDANTSSAALASGAAGAHYYIDEIVVETTTSSPVITVNNPTICAGETATLTASSNIAGTTYLWNTGATTNPLLVSPAVTTIYTVTGTAPSGQTGTASTTVTVNPLPTITASASPTTICAGSSSNISATSSLGSTTYSWDQGLGAGANHTVSPTTTTTYTVTGTANGCSGTDNVIVTVNPLPTITASASPTTICSGNSSNISATSSLGSTTYSWDQGLGAGANHTVSPTTTTTYTVTGTANGCSGTDNVIVTVNPTPVITATAVNDTICLGATSNLSATSSVTGSTYNWDQGLGAGATHTVNPVTTTTYTVTGTANGCTGTADAIVTVVPSIIIDISTIDSVLCIGDSTQLTVIGAPGGSSYLWNTTSTQSSIIVKPTTTTTYSVTASSAGCDGTSDILITVNPLPVVTLLDDTICNGDNANLLASGASTYTWNTGSTTNPLNVSPSLTTSYSVTGTDVNGCVDTASAEIMVIDPPTLNISGTDAHCNQSDGSATVIATGGSGVYTYVWNTTNTNYQLNNIPSGTYTVTVSDNGCDATASINIANLSGPQAVFTVNPDEAEINEFIQFTDASMGATTWSWDFGDGQGASGLDPTHSYSFPGLYTSCLVVEDGFGCEDSTCKKILIRRLFTFYIPNSFSPDENSINDIFIPTGVGIDEDRYIMQVYDRWGKLVFETEDLYTGWNGTINGTSISDDEIMGAVFLYYFKVFEEYTDIDHEYRGVVTLIK